MKKNLSKSILALSILAVPLSSVNSINANEDTNSHKLKVDKETFFGGGKYSLFDTL